MKKLLVAFFSLCGILALCQACTPEVKISGDAANPIAINAEINIHIYQHAEEVVDDLYAGLDEEPEPEPDAAAESFWSRCVAALVNGTCVGSCEAAPAQKKSPSYEAMKKAFAETFTKYMKTGYVGEGADGYAAYVGKAEKSDAKTVAAAKESMNKLNAARKVFYAEEAKNQKSSVADVQKAYAAVYASRAKGVWVQTAGKDGKLSWAKQ